MEKSTSYSIIFTLAICSVIGASLYAWFSSSHSTQITQLQQEIAVLQGQLEVRKTQVEHDKTLEAEKEHEQTQLLSSIRSCGETPEQSYIEQLTEGLQIEYLEKLKEYVPIIGQKYKEGYLIHDICQQDNHLVTLFSISQESYQAAVAETTEDMPTRQQEFVVMDIDMTDDATYMSTQATVPTYRMEGPGSNYCMIDTAVEDTVLFTCTDAVDGHNTTDWYAVDLEAQTQTTVKQYESTYDYNTEERTETEDILDEELLLLFSSSM